MSPPELSRVIVFVKITTYLCGVFLWAFKVSQLAEKTNAKKKQRLLGPYNETFQKTQVSLFTPVYS